jgi:hypothetical protein
VTWPRATEAIHYALRRQRATSFMALSLFPLLVASVTAIKASSIRSVNAIRPLRCRDATVLLIDRFGTKHMQREGMASRDANGRGRFYLRTGVW